VVWRAGGAFSTTTCESGIVQVSISPCRSDLSRDELTKIAFAALSERITQPIGHRPLLSILSSLECIVGEPVTGQ
jgi:hypothetical protein